MCLFNFVDDFEGTLESHLVTKSSVRQLHTEFQTLTLAEHLAQTQCYEEANHIQQEKNSHIQSKAGIRNLGASRPASLLVSLGGLGEQLEPLSK